MARSIWDDLRPRQDAITSALGDWLTRVCAETPPALAEAMRYSLLAPGKRLRPLLTLLACEAVGGQFETAIPAAVAIEMIHTYSLIHDDLPAMDDDDLRRGLPTCHKQFGEALAILAGDALLTAAFEVVTAGYPPATAAVITLEMARAAGAGGMVGGQVLDLAAEGRIAGTAPLYLPHLESIHRRKTGALFRSALRNGIHSAALADSTIALQHVDRYAAGFGLAFQITDDLLDVESSAEMTGKRVGKDAIRGKLTYPGLLGIEKSRDSARRYVDEAVAAARHFGQAGEPLACLAEHLIQRDR